MTTAQYEDLFTMLQGIRFSLDRLEARVAAKPADVPAPPPAAAQALEVADTGDLDGPYGDPEIRKDPPRWTGESQVGKRYSECPADYLESLAGFNTWRAQKDDESGAVDAKGRPKSYWAKLDAARARGWAQRIRGSARVAPRVTAHTSSAKNGVAYVPKPVDTATEADDVPF